jgi:oligopeptide transport system substrate-binding protein
MIEVQTRRAFLMSACGAPLVLVAACGDPSTTSTNAGAASTQAPGLMVVNRGNGAEPASLDPHHTQGTWEFNIVGEMIVGLTTEDQEAKPIPGAAEKWETSEDGKTWTFHLRDHQWSDGKPVTAQDFVYAWQRILNPKTAAQYASFLYIFKNAEAVNGGKMPVEMLAAKAIDDKTLQVELEHPAPYITELMMHQTAYPVPRHVVEAKGDAWTKPENYVGNGPYLLKEWVPNDHITLSKNPRFYDAGNVKIDSVNYYPTQDADAGLRRFRAGDLDTQDPIPPLQIDFLRANLPLALKVQPSLSVFYISINVTKPPFDDIRIREALNLAYDRETMVEKVLKLGELPAYGMVPPSTANYPGSAALRFKTMAPEERLARAQALMRAVGYGPAHMLHAKLSATTAATTKQTLAPIQEMWKKIYVDIEIIQSDTPANYQKLEQGDFELGTAAWVAATVGGSKFRRAGGTIGNEIVCREFVVDPITRFNGITDRF